MKQKASTGQGRKNICRKELAYRTSGGFTLLEVLISISLLMVVIALAGTAMRMSINSVTAGEKKIESMERFRSSLHIISAQIGSEFPLLDDSVNKKTIFSGKKRFLRTPTGYSIWSGWRGYVILEYQIVDEEKGKKGMMVSEETIGPTKKMETRLLSGMDSISFEYLSKNKDMKGEGIWIEEWEDKNSIPEQVKLNFTFEGIKYAWVMPMRPQIAAK